MVRDLPAARAILERGLAEQIYPAVAAEIGTSAGPLWRLAAGRLAYDNPSPATLETIFDLGSLTKVLATTTIALQMAARGQLDLEARVADHVAHWRAADRQTVTIRDLLEHCSGLPAHREYFRHLSGREAYERAIAAEPLEYAPRTRALYSDLGFILAGIVIERLSRQPLDEAFDRWRAAIGLLDPLDFRPPAAWIPFTACTEQCAWRGRLLQGEVFDENAAALGGVAGHAGLFGTAGAVGGAARWWLARLLGTDDDRAGVPASLARAFAARSRVPESSRAVGWDTMRPSSSCGRRMSARAIGHTGFTGTSLWIDPERDLYFVLLTNRVHPTRTREGMQEVRRAFHDAALEELLEDRSRWR